MGKLRTISVREGVKDAFIKFYNDLRKKRNEKEFRWISNHSDVLEHLLELAGYKVDRGEKNNNKQ